MSFLKSIRLWTILGAMAGLGSLLYIFIVDQWLRPPSLTGELVSVSALLNDTVRNEGKELQVLFGDMPVKNFAIARVRIGNTGGTNIRTTDFESPLTIDFTGIEKIYFVELDKSILPKINVIFDINSRSISISPLLLNSGDSFAFDIGIDISDLADTNTVKMDVYGRIVGVSNINVVYNSNNTQEINALLGDFDAILRYFLTVTTVTLALPLIFVITVSIRDRRRERSEELIEARLEERFRTIYDIEAANEARAVILEKTKQQRRDT